MIRCFKATIGVHEVHFLKILTLYHLSKVITNIKGPSAYISIGLWWNCSDETGFISLVKMSWMDPPGGLKMGFSLYMYYFRDIL